MATAKTREEIEEAHAPSPTPHQLRHLHALLRDHGITTDEAVHNYLSSVMSEYRGTPWVIVSRKELSRTEMAHVIADLEANPYRGLTDEKQAALLRPFPPEQVGKLPRSTCRDCSNSSSKVCQNHKKTKCQQCGGYHSTASIHLDFVGHADLTARLLEVDPHWTWEPMAWNTYGLPMMDDDGGLWIKLTVCGVSRYGYGDAEGKKGPNATKEKIGDALRNAGMRFGIALDLWAKGDRDYSATAEPVPDQTPTERIIGKGEEQTVFDDDLTGKSTMDLLTILADIADEQNKTWGEFTARWRQNLGGLDINEIESLPPEVVAEQIRTVRKYLKK